MPLGVMIMNFVLLLFFGDQALAHDCQALYRFGFESTDAAEMAGWLLPNVSNATWCCAASGVQCSTTTAPPGQRVTSVQLPDLSISGTLDDIAHLTQLTALFLGNNQLSGTIDAVAKLTQLTQLGLYGNQLSGSIDAVANLTQLTQLGLGSNQFSGTIDAVANLTQLTQLGLDANQLSGTIDAVANLAQLTLFYPGNNQFSGTIDAVANLTQLTQLDMYTNQFSGTIDAVVNLLQLTQLGVGYNRLSGTIDAVANLIQLTQLGLDTNAFSGAIDAIANLTQLTVLIMGNNQFSGTMDAVANLTQLIQLDLYSNQFSGTIDAVSNLTQLTELGLFANQFSGTIDAVANLTQLTVLDLDTNQLSGSIDAIAYLSQLTHLYMYANQFSGTIDALNKLALLTALDLDDNQLSGTIDVVANLAQLTLLYLDTNQFKGTLDAVANLTQLTQVDLNFNQLSGTMDAVVNLTQLTLLYLGNNRLSGPIDALANLKQLSLLDLNTNDLSCTINAVANLTQLTVLDLSDNQFSGTMDAMVNLRQLTELDLSTNQLSGTIDVLANLLQLTRIHVNANRLSGSVKTLQPLGDSVQTLDVSDNQFDSLGLPLSAFAVASYLNFSHNRLHGVSLSASRDIPNVASPVVLDISANSFWCPFPEWPERVVFLHSACLYPLETYAVYTGVGAAVLLVGGVLWLKRDVLWHAQKPFCACLPFFNLAWLLYSMWLMLIWLALVNDCVATAEMIRYVLSPRSYCSEANNPHLFAAQVTTFACGAQRVPYGDSFSAFVRNLLAQDVTACGAFGSAVVQAAAIDPFARFCQRFPSCGYVPAPTYACAQTKPDVIAYRGHHGFYTAVLCVIAVRAAYMILSLVAVWRMSQYLRSVSIFGDKTDGEDRRSNFWLYDLAAQSFFAPFAVLTVPSDSRAELFRWAVVDYRVTSAELYRRLWLSAVWYQLPQLAMTTYYALRVTETGLSDSDVLSIMSAVVAVCFMFARASWRWWEDRNDKRESHQSRQSSLSHMENMTAREYLPLEEVS